MFYVEKIDEKKTIQKVKRYMEFLGTHMNSYSYQEYMLKQSYKQPMMVHEEDVMDYMNYTKSIISMEQTKSPDKNYVLQAIYQKEEVQKQKQERELQIRWLCFGLQQLKEKQRTFLIERYVFHLSNLAIIERHGIVESTLNRTIRKACLNLAMILKIEVLDDCPS